MTEINQANGHGPADAHRPLVPAQRAPEDASPPGVWRGAPPSGPSQAVAPARARPRPLRVVRRVVTHPRVRTVPVVAVKGVARAVVHPRTRAVAGTVAKTGFRQGVFVVAGGRIVARRTWDARTTARHERMMRAAEAVGDHAVARDWEARAEAHRAARHERRMRLLSAPVIVAKGLLFAAAGLLTLGIVMAFSSHHVSDVMRPLRDAGDAISWSLSTAAALWHPITRFGPWVALACLWGVGRTRGEAPGWLATSMEGEELVIDERTITLAIKALNIKNINNHLKQGLPLQYITPVREDGRGTFAAIRLPGGVPALEVVKKRVALAAGLHRAVKEVWPSVGVEAGILTLWIADKGVLEEGAGEYPLLTDGATDFFKGFPLGKTLRGVPVLVPMAGRNTLVGGAPDQGKSTAARDLVAGAALDPTCEIRIWVPDANFDFEAFKDRASTYVMGAEDEKIKDIRDDLKKLKAELQSRGRLLIRHRRPEVTRDLADKVAQLRPMVCLLEEAQVAFNHPKFGKEIRQLVVDIVKLDRKRAVHFIVSTQAPTKDSIPRDVTRNCTVGLAFSVGDHVANDALLGEGAYRAGHRATELIPGVDKGTCLAKGINGQRSEAVQAYFISVAENNDQITPLISRALDAVKFRNNAVLTAPEVDVADIDVLADVEQAMRGEDLVGTEEVVHRLKVLRPGFYDEWTTTDLAKALKPHGAAPRKAGKSRTMHADLAMIRDAIQQRDDATADEPDDETGVFEDDEDLFDH
jgi:S-DNA-T family DNA segregation ATPase FtsK/SpoIIIE